MVPVSSNPAPGDFVEEEFGPYRLVRRLGVGGMAQTFEAVRRGPSGFSQHVCLKLVLPYFRDNESFAKLFTQEAKLAAKLRHSNIVGVIDFGEIDGTLYIALELVDGVDLQVLLDAQDRNRLPHPYVALIGRDVARALEHAHSPRPGTGIDGSGLNAIIHRDISPSNVLISRHGEVMLTDFGVAKAVTDTWGKQSNVKGKIPYMSPEQLMGDAVDGRADLYSLGVVLFEALSGKRPYAGANDPATIMMALSGDHVPLVELAPETPPALCALIESLLQPDRDKRPKSATALIEMLDDLAPPSRTRRELGEMIAQAPVLSSTRENTGVERSGGGSTGRNAAAFGEAATTPARSRAEPKGSTPEAKRRRRRDHTKKAALALLAAGGIAGSGAALWWSGSQPDGAPSIAPEASSVETSGVEEPEPDAASMPGTAVPSRDEAEAVLEESADRVEEKADPPRDARQVRPARLTVVVFPFGDVWINGKRRGSAPLKNEVLKAGTYKISVGQGRPSRTRTVRLRPGQRENLVFDLTAPN